MNGLLSTLSGLLSKSCRQGLLLVRSQNLLKNYIRKESRFFTQNTQKEQSMRNHVTFETSVRLKEAGFPQPVPEEGQLWYNPKTERLCIILFNRAKWSFRVSYFGSASNKGGYLKDNFMFAPTAADILRELGMSYWQRFHEEDGVFHVFSDKYWEDSFGDTVGAFVETSRHQNPAEAAAQAFINLKSRK